MDIKEIALKVADSLRNRVDGISRVQSNQGLARFAEALISAYKAELLKEVGEPVLYAEFAEDGGWLGDASEYADHLEEPHALFTSDQVAAAIIKATKPLEERRCEICGYAEHHREHTGCLRTQLAAAQEEINEWRGKHDVACLTITKLQKQYEIQLAATSKAMGAEESLLIVNYQLAKAEQRVSEACAKWIDGYAGIHQKEMLSDTAKSFADALRRGEWRKFVKEV